MGSVRHESAASALSCVRSGDRLFVHGASATPLVLLRGLLEHAPRLRDVELIHLHLAGDCEIADSRYAESFRFANLFVGPGMRKRLDGDRVDYLPCFLSEIPALFRSRRRKLDVALVHVSTPDAHGYCSLGTSVDVARAAVDSATTVVAQVNPRMPRVLGDGVIHIDQIHHWVQVDEPLPEAPRPALGDEERAIGAHAASLIEDGSTLQMGIGAIPDAVLEALAGHQHLGVHTEMWSDGLLPLLRSGAVDNSAKAVHRGKTVSGFVVGSRAVYDFVNDNPSVLQLDVAYVNSAAVIARNPRVAAINSAVEVDLTGQVCADSIGHHVISGVGGQMDFIRGASLSPGGKPIIALPSRTKSGESRIVTTLKTGAGVVTTRAHVHYVVTEHGVADLYGRTLNERAHALIRVAHPDDREGLERQWREVRLRYD
ncbi:MAG: acetyl-CoA hydrolase/transferase family protein [Myxococcales bacterium]|nr:acetyl-CoA hydrolase/transferase family protein [Myxococcales bacterium]MCB9530876.1 acetyl-CoA hydrolase/transferase family protein [Myxococcales bacterium]MCB9534332.1 acetyl-CoA hydrolase/transferase family protein [Myxococcales bacterium]